MGESNNDRRSEARQRFQLKSDVLGSFCVDGVPQGYVVPKSMNEFRCWVDPSLGVQRLGSPSATNRILSPENIDLIDKVRANLNTLKTQKGKPRSKAPTLSSQLDTKARELQQQHELNARLCSQLHESMQRTDTAERDLRSSKDVIERYGKTEAQLRKRIAELSKSLLRAVP
jgi:hypothetical protein